MMLEANTLISALPVPHAPMPHARTYRAFKCIFCFEYIVVGVTLAGLKNTRLGHELWGAVYYSIR